MTNPISNLFSGNASLEKSSLDKAKRQALDRPADTTLSETGKAAKANAMRDDVLVLSDVAKRAMAEPSFDRNKVEAIKQALKDGNYPMNSRRIAESFASMEKLIG